MPTFPTVAFERLLESPSPGDRPLSSKPEANVKTHVKSTTPHIYFTPALYATPNPTPVPCSSPSSMSPSPYVINRKRREIPPPEIHFDGFHVKDQEGSQPNGTEGTVNQVGHDSSLDASVLEEEEIGNASEHEIFDGDDGVLADGSEKEEEVALDEIDNLCDSISLASSCGSIGRSVMSKGRILSSQSDYFDASEEFFSDGSSSRTSRSFSENAAIELHAAKMSLLEEIARRKKAEESLVYMRSLWQRLAENLHQIGFSLPTTSEARNVAVEVDLGEQFCQEIMISRLVFEAVGRGQACAEAEAAAQEIIDSKNQEIARLQEKLQYYEAVNREMSQRNQEIKEASRTERQRQQRKKKMIWSFIGFSTALGASFFACSYLLDSRHPPVTSHDVSDTI